MSTPIDAARAYIHDAQTSLDLALEALGEEPEPEPAPPVYATAIQDRVVREKPPLPDLAPAGYVFTDPSFHTTIRRVTDGTKSGSWHVASNAHVATWNADSTRFYLLGPEGKKVFELYADGSAHLVATVSSQCEPTFSRTDPALIYGVGGPSTRTIQSSTIADDGTVTVTDLLDLDTLLLDLAEPRTYVGGMVSADAALAFFFGGTGQDQHVYAGVLTADGATFVNTLTEPGLHFKLHSISIDRTGRFVVLYPVGAKPFHMVIWDVLGQTFTPVTEAPWGHDTQGYGLEVNHDVAPNRQDWDAAQWVIRPLDRLDTATDLITPVLRPKEVYLDDHACWHNARPDRRLPVITATYRYNNEAAPWRPWDDEVIAIATEGASVVYRFCHHRSDASDDTDPAGTYFWYQPIPSVSPDGRFVLFGSNWEKTLGADPGAPGRVRTDVFLVTLPT